MNQRIKVALHSYFQQTLLSLPMCVRVWLCQTRPHLPLPSSMSFCMVTI